MKLKIYLNFVVEIFNDNKNMSELIYNKDLANRFASDYKLPIPITFKKEYFFYYLDLLERDYESLTKYKVLCKLIEEKFDNDPVNFLNEYYNIRENIIQATLANPAYVDFNTKLDMQKFAIKDKINVSSNNVYNCENKDKRFLSIDLKKANFQVLKKTNPKIVLNADTYEDFIGKFTDLDYVKESKYTRQVIFGKLNPKRHITIEKYYINEVRKTLEEYFASENCQDSFKLVSMTNDELVYENVSGEARLPVMAKLHDLIKDKLDLEVRVEGYALKVWQMLFAESEKVSKTFFVKVVYASTEHSKFFMLWNTCNLVAVPTPFFPIIYKLFWDLPLDEKDYHINYEGMDVIVNEKFKLKELKNEEKIF